jgi:molybdopterin-binding protein
VEIRDRGQLLEVLVDVGVTLVALVTPGGAAELELEPGSSVSVSVKAAAVVVVPA